MSERLCAIVDGLGIRHDDRVLEIGCEDWQELFCVSSSDSRGVCDPLKRLEQFA